MTTPSSPLTLSSSPLVCIPSSIHHPSNSPDDAIKSLPLGYRSMRDSCRKIFGSAIADRTREVYGLDAQGEIRGLWRRSGHPGFWFMGGVSALISSCLRCLLMLISPELDPGADILQVPCTADCGGRGGSYASGGAFVIVWEAGALRNLYSVEV